MPPAKKRFLNFDPTFQNAIINEKLEVFLIDFETWCTEFVDPPAKPLTADIIICEIQEYFKVYSEQLTQWRNKSIVWVSKNWTGLIVPHIRGLIDKRYASSLSQGPYDPGADELQVSYY
jgi:hypothetical protein